MNIRNNSLITGNTAGLSGGGLFADGSGTIVVDRTTFSGNRALAGTGGGIGLINTNAPGSATLRSTTINNNTAATSGGGVALRNFNFLMENTTISTNTAGTVGGGISYGNVASSGQRTLSFSTITSNVAPGGGSNLNATGSVINVAATIFNNGTIVAAPGVLVSQGNNLDSGNTSGFSQPTDLLNSNPLLGPLQNNGGAVFTHLPLFGSAAIDAGPATGLTTDARGFTRPLDGDGDGVARRDIGAAEGEMAIVVFVDGVSVNESAVNATVTVRLPNAIAGGFTVNFATANGTAIQPDDYTSRSGTLTFAGTAGEIRTFTIPIINDAIVEASETIRVSLSNPSKPAVSASDTATVAVTDSDVAALTVADVTVNENAGTATVTVIVNNAVQGGFTVNFATSNGTATQPSDYTTTAGTLTFTGTSGESRTFTIPIINDAIVEASETIRVSLSNPSKPAISASDTAAVTITDNDSNSGTPIHRLSTGTGDGDVTLDVDSFGTFGTDSGSFTFREATYNPVGPVPVADAMVSSLIAFRTASSGPYALLQESTPTLSVTQAVSGSLQRATSVFTTGSFSVSLAQAVAPTLGSNGTRLGAQLTQSYTITNTGSTATTLDLVRYLDADLSFDGSLTDGGGVLRDQDGNLIVF